MKKTQLRALCLFLLLALTLPLLFGCGAETPGEEHARFSEVYRNDPVLHDRTGFTKHEVLTDALPANLEDGVGKNGFFRYRVTADDKYYVYSVKHGRIVVEIEKSSVTSGEDILLLDGYIAVVERATRASTTLVYSESGKLLASREGAAAVSVTEDGFLMDGVLYVVADGTLQKSTPTLPLADASTVYGVFGDFVVVKGNKSLSYYDARASLVKYTAPENAKSFTFFVLADGKTIVQYVTPVDPAATQYDFAEKGEKFALHQQIFDPARNKAKDLKLDGVYLDTLYNERNSPFENADFYDVFREDVENVMRYRTIVDGTLATSSRYVLLEDNAEFGDAIDAFVEGQIGLVAPVNGARYYAKTETGGALLDANGALLKPVAKFDKLTAYGAYGTPAGRMHGVLYDQSLAPVYDFDGVTHGAIHTKQEDVLFFFKKVDGEHYAYRYDANGEAPILFPNGDHATNYDVRISDDGYYVLSQSFTDYYYATNGTLLFAAMSVYETPYPEVIVKADNAILFRYVDAETGATVYARIAK